MAKKILVTGANSGIGLALVKRLTTEHNCFVYLGSRNLERGQAAKKSIVDKHPNVAEQIEIVQVDVGSDDSVKAAAASLQSKNVRLDALVNNAGVGFNTGTSASAILNVNYEGPKRVTAAFVDMVDKGGRIVNFSSGVASVWVRDQDAATKALYSNPESLQQLDEHVQSLVDADNVGAFGGYGLSKAALTALTIIHAKQYSNLTVVSLSPGYVDTNMTKGFGAPLTPEQGCKSALKCLFGEVTTGWYYGSDGLRSPLTVSRDPGTPEYQGEANPDAAVYNE